MEKLDTLLQQIDHSTEFQNNQDIILLKPKFLAIWILESLTVEDEEKELLRDIWQSNWLGEHKKLVVRVI